ncbi:MAG: hypothetical protein AVDCRST_MAG45-2381, partial [uncultured Solirubrobacterales bacterium]
GSTRSTCRSRIARSGRVAGQHGADRAVEGAAAPDRGDPPRGGPRARLWVHAQGLERREL